MNGTVLIRCDATAEIGYGHVIRCLVLADELHARRGSQVAFAMVRNPSGTLLVRERGYQVHQAPSRQIGLEWDEGRWLKQVIAETGADILILDVRTELAAISLREMRDRGVLIVTIDDPSNRRLVADLAFYPPVPQVRRFDWTGFTGQLFVGWDWIILRPEFQLRQQSRARQSLRTPHSSRLAPGSPPLSVLVTMGGSDPAGLTLRALAALDPLEGDFATSVVLGPSFMHEDALGHWLAKARRSYCLRRTVRNMAGVMAESDLAVASFGVTAYELAALGIPAVHLCLTEDHAESASVLMVAGMAVSLGVHTQVSTDQLSGVLSGWLSDTETARMISGPPLIDGCGAQRIGNILTSQ